MMTDTANSVSVAEHTLAFMLALAKKVVEMDAMVHERGERCIQFRVIVRPTHEKLLIDRFGRRFDIRQFLHRRREVRVYKYSNQWDPRHEFAQQTEPFRLRPVGPEREAGDIAAGVLEARHHAGLDGVASHPEHDWNRLGCLRGSDGGNIATDANKHSHPSADQFRSERR